MLRSRFSPVLRIASLLRRSTAIVGLLALVQVLALAPMASAQVPPSAGASALTSSVSSVVQTAQIRAELVAHAPDGIEAGKPFWVGLLLTHQPHWHTYWKNPGDSGLATQAQWDLPRGATAGEIAWPVPQKITVGSLANYGYEGKVLLPVPVTLDRSALNGNPPGLAAGNNATFTIKLFASWLVCSQECVPQEGHFVLQVPVRGSTALHQADFEAAQRAQPRAIAGPAQARLQPEGMTLTVSGLPSSWRGKPVNVYPETSDILDPSSTPSEAAKGGRSAPQRWDGDVWTSTVKLSPQRMESPKSLPLVFSQGVESVVTTAPIQGNWPAAGAGVAGSAPAPASALTPTPTPDASNNGSTLTWMVALAWAFLGGLILNLMPCVFPVLAIKVLSLVKQGTQHRTQHRLEGLAYSAGVVLSFMALGALMLALRAGGEQLGWGFQLQTPWVIAALAILFTVLGFNLAGMLEFGTLVPSNIASLQLNHPVGNAFLSGVLAVAVASPCTAPFMGASLGYAISLPAMQALGIFAALGVGLALPFGLISWVPGLARWLPRPGPWMGTLRHTMAFPMWATVVWLIWVHGHLSGVDGAASLLALLLTLALLIWALNRPSPERKVLSALALAVILGVLATLGSNVLKMESSPAVAMGAQDMQGAQDVQWQPWSADRVAAEVAAGTPVFVDFTAAWCITCQYNKKTTLSHPDVLRDFADRKVRLLRADWTRRDPAITQALQNLGRSGVPVYVLYQANKPPKVLSEILTVDEVRTALAGL